MAKKLYNLLPTRHRRNLHRVRGQNWEKKNFFRVLFRDCLVNDRNLSNSSNSRAESHRISIFITTFMMPGRRISYIGK